MRGMITAPQPLAVDAGAKVLADGGNAVDSAVAAAFVQMVATPRSCGVGGFGMMNIHTAATKQEIILDFHGKAGAKVEPDMWEDVVIRESNTGYGYALKDEVNARGYKAITTPGTVAGLYKALTEHGTMTWHEVIQPGIKVATEGIEVTSSTATAWKREPIGSETSPWIDMGKSPYEGGGEFIANPDMAKAFAIIAEGGVETFYHGDLAMQMAQDMERGGGFVTLEDLNNYKVTVTQPVCSDYRGYTVASNHPPGGGVTILQVLKILEGYDLAGMGYLTPEYVYTVALAMKAAWVDRANLVGDSAFVDVPIEDLLSESRAMEWRRRIDAREKISIPRWQPKDSPDTTHLSVVDQWGNVVGLTHSLGSGADVITQGLGFMYNNCMNCFNPIPGQVNSIEPGKSRVTCMAPTLVKSGEKAYFTVGAPGGTRIATGIIHAILNVIDHGMTATEAIAAPRFDSQSDVIYAHARIPPSVCERVKEMGHDINRSLSSYGGIASVHGIIIDPETGKLDGGADPGAGGMALGVI
ncbi:gamma-glutamyltransferase [Candidatus Poribacteria bacterium]